ncbi:MAG: hypothetical protein CH6_1667 [Candidatus Kapaibacterium sp.]|nr:MAG: hypothetical protein CH6_1667 [Candidatus Kapabacteria bacterium]ROL57829.1 MAG: hypothetical protein D9V84_03700 [Bacteroidetes/Chlorobi group bacterium Naka2016]
MNQTKLFWGLFFISLGVFYILDLLPFWDHPYHLNLKFFPLVLTFAGILLLRTKKIVTTIAIILMSILLSSTVFSTYKYLKYDGFIRWHYFIDCNDN